MATQTALIAEVVKIVHDDFFDSTDILALLNKGIGKIAGGIKMPNGQISPVLPDLYTSGTVDTSTTAAYKALPADYMRKVFMVLDSNADRINPPKGGDYYSFMKFMNFVSEKDLSESGSIYTCCVKGSNLYYQGIPTASEELIVQYYRKPTDMEGSAQTTPDGIPSHLQSELLVNYVCAEIFGIGIGGTFDPDKDIIHQPGQRWPFDKKKKRWEYHKSAFISAMWDLIELITDQEEAEPMYYESDFGDAYDGGICD